MRRIFYNAAADRKAWPAIPFSVFLADSMPGPSALSPARLFSFLAAICASDNVSRYDATELLVSATARLYEQRRSIIEACRISAGQDLEPELEYLPHPRRLCLAAVPDPGLNGSAFLRR